MKSPKTILSLICSVVLFLSVAWAAEPEPVPQPSEYATIRWDGRDNTYVIRPNGKVERLRTLFQRFPRPDGVDDRTYYLNIAMNAVAKEGFEFAGTMGGEIVVMKRTAAK